MHAPHGGGPMSLRVPSLGRARDWEVSMEWLSATLHQNWNGTRRPHVEAAISSGWTNRLPTSSRPLSSPIRRGCASRPQVHSPRQCARPHAQSCALTAPLQWREPYGLSASTGDAGPSLRISLLACDARGPLHARCGGWAWQERCDETQGIEPALIDRTSSADHQVSE